MNISLEEVLPRLRRAQRQNERHPGCEERTVARLEGVVDFMIEGCIRCDCGCKYWEHGRCIDCGTDVERYVDQEVGR